MSNAWQVLGASLAVSIVSASASASTLTGGPLWSYASGSEGWTGRTVAVGNLGNDVVTQVGPYFDHTRIYSGYDQNPPVPVVDTVSSVATFHHQVDAADTRDLAVSIHDVYADQTLQTRRVIVRRFSASSPGTNWTYQHPNLTNGHDRLAVRVTRSGNRIVAVIYNQVTNRNEVVVFGPDSPTPIANLSIDAGTSFKALDLSADGTRLLLATNLQAKVISLPDGAVLHTEWIFEPNFGAWGISGDGTYFAYGTLGKAKVFKRNGAGAYALYAQPLSPSGGTWACDRLDLSDDNSTIALAFNLTDTYRTIAVASFDLNTLAQTMSANITGQGSLQVCVSDVSISSDGSRFAVGDWGDEQGLAPEVVVYERTSSTPLRVVDLAGSALSVDLSSDGDRVAVASKAVHANSPGGGGSVALYQVQNEDVRLVGQPRVNTSVEAQVQGTVGHPAMLLVSPTLRATPLNYPGIGTLYLGSSGLQRRAIGSCDGNGISHGLWTIPNAVGSTVYVQGFATMHRRLSDSWFAVTLLP